MAEMKKRHPWLRRWGDCLDETLRLRHQSDSIPESRRNRLLTVCLISEHNKFWKKKSTMTYRHDFSSAMHIFFKFTT